MPLINLEQIQELTKIRQPLSFVSQKSNLIEPEFDSLAAVNFHLVMKQLFMGLPVESLLEAYPQIQQWVYELQKLAPELFQNNKKFLVNTPIIAPLILGNNQLFIQVLTNLAFKQGIPRIYEWAIRRPALNWQDRIKLWATANQYSVSPEQLQVVILAVHSTKTAQRLDVRWNQKYHKQTEQWLIQLLNQPPEIESKTSEDRHEIMPLLDIEAIPEVAI